jgi:hypothetical protein
MVARIVIESIEALRRQGFSTVRGLVDPARTERLRTIADGLRERYLRCDPVSGRRGFLVAPWSVTHLEHAGFYVDTPEWWFPELMALIADPLVLDLWQTATGDQAQLAVAALFIDPVMPLSADLGVHAGAAVGGAGRWHRDTAADRSDEDEREELLRGGLDEAGKILEIALVPSHSFEYVPGSHTRWDTPLELRARRHGQTMAERTQPLPGACRVTLGAGDALLVDTRGIHRGWYTHGVARRTLTLWYLSAERLARYPGERPNLCLPDRAQIELLPADVRGFFQRAAAAVGEGGAGRG